MGERDDGLCFHCHERKPDPRFDHTDLEGLCDHCFENDLRAPCSSCRTYNSWTEWTTRECGGGVYLFGDEKVPSCYED